MAFDILSYLNSTGASQAFVGNADRSQAVNPSQNKPAAAPSFGASILHSLGAIPGGIEHAVIQPTINAGVNLAHEISGNIGVRNAQNSVDARNQQLQKQQNSIISDFKSGKTSRETYTQQLRGLQAAGQQESNAAHAVAAAPRAGYGQVASNVVPLAGAAATLLSGGIAAPEVAAADEAATGIGAKALSTVSKGLGAGKTLGSNPVTAVAGKLARNALVTQPVIQAPGQTVQDVQKGNMGGAALNVAALAAPGIVKGVQKLAELAPVAKEALFGKQGFFDAVKQAGGPDFLAHLDNLSGKQQQNATDLLRKVQQYNVDQFSGDAKAAGQHFSQYLENQGAAGANMTEPQAMKHLSEWVKANEQFNAEHAAGRLAGSPGGEPIGALKPGQTIIAGRFNQNDAQTLKAALENVPVAGRNEVLTHMEQAGADWGKNKLVRDQVYEAAQHEDFGKALDSNLQSMRSLSRTPSSGSATLDALKNVPSDEANRKYGSYGSGDKIVVDGKTYTVAGKNYRISGQNYVNVKEREPQAGLNDRGQSVINTSRIQSRTSALDAAVPSTPAPSTKPFMSKQGYFPTISNNARASFKDVADTAPIERGKAGVPALNAVASTFGKMGLSPSAVDNSVVRGALNRSLQAEMDARGIPGKAQSVLNTLGTVNKSGGLDARNLSKTDILGALGTGYNGKEGDIQQALKAAYAKLPASLVGAGPKALNQAINKVPGLASYLRVQSIGRYEANPFFRLKQYIKSGLVAGVEGARPGVSATKDDMNALQDSGLLAARGSKFGGDATLAGQTGGQGNKLMDPVMRKLVGNVAASIAQKNGMTVREILQSDTPLAREMKNSLGLVTSYGKGGYLNSPLAKTLNLIIFPSRFDTKIAMEAGKAFAKASPVTQMAAASGLANAHNFLNSPAGQQWQKDNGTLLGLLSSFTPLGTLNNFSNFISKGGHIGDLGELGGLPVGVLTQILQSSGVNLGKFGSSQQNNPQTGQPYANQVGTDTKGRLQLGLTDFINSLYSFPGKNAGLGSKTSVTQTVVPALKPTAKDTQYRYQNGQPAPSISKSSKATSISAPRVAPTVGTVPKITAPSGSSGLPGPKIRVTRPKVYAKKYGQPL